MNNFKSWGIKVRKGPGYFAVWNNLKTIRLDIGPEQELQPNRAEFYDVSITSRCNAMCPFCYVSAGPSGIDSPNPCETWNKFIATFPEDEVNYDLQFGLPEENESLEMLKLRFMVELSKELNRPITKTEKPFQIAIGSTGESTVHPDFCKFLETVYNSGVVPNYTTNGILLSDLNNTEIFEYTKNFCGGVAISFGNRSLRDYARKAIDNLIQYGDCKVIVHHIISDKQSVDEFIELQEIKDIHYHVLLPLMKHGRSNKEMEPGVYEYLAVKIKENDITNVAFGANFTKWMKENPGLVDVWDYPQEIYSKNLILEDNKIIITPSSFNLNPIKEICVS